MKGIISLIILVGLSVYSVGSDMRKFTSADGSKTLNAKVLDYSQSKGTVKILRSDSKVMTVPVKALSKNDKHAPSYSNRLG